jgi:hypothetical protein
MVAPMDWTDAMTLEEFVGRLFQEGKTEGAEFGVLVRIYGKAKMDEYLRRVKESQTEPSQLSWFHTLGTRLPRDD